MPFPTIVMNWEDYFREEIDKQWEWKILYDDLCNVRRLVKDRINQLQTSNQQQAEELENRLYKLPQEFIPDFNSLIILRGILAGYHDMYKLTQKLIEISKEKVNVNQINFYINSVNEKFTDKLKYPVELLLMMKNIPLRGGNLDKADLSGSFNQAGYFK